MVIERQNITGIDSEILRLQKIIDTLDYNDLIIYGRLYKNLLKDGNYIPEGYLSEGEYKDVFLDDRSAGVVGVIVNDFEHEKGINFSNIDIIFTFRLDKISAKLNRYDEEIVENVFNLLEENGYEITGRKEGVNEVLNGFDVERYKFRDMQPYFIFSVQTKIIYTYNNCKN